MARPDAHRSIASYRTLARRYDASCRRVAGVREEAVTLLALEAGDVVVDVGSGTGLSFPLIMRALGPRGHLFAIEHSPEMMAIARRRVEDAGWRNVTLIESSAEAADLASSFDAILFHFTHDILQSPVAMRRLLERAKPGARVVAAGAKLATGWLAPLNVWTMFRVRRYVTTYAGLGKPWRNLLPCVPDLEVRDRQFGTAYVAAGRLQGGAC